MIIQISQTNPFLAISVILGLAGGTITLVNWLARKSTKRETASNFPDDFDLQWEVIHWQSDRIKRLEKELKDLKKKRQRRG